MSAEASILKPYFLRDLAEGIQQQMYFWGQDVLRPEGNFFVEQGFERLPSTGIKGTSCYRKEWQGGSIELYGACAGWYGENGGFAFIRPRRRCVVWNSAEETPIPGEWQLDLMDKSASKSDLYEASLPFLNWLIEHEQSVLDRFGIEYRNANYLSYKKVPKAKAWLQPEEALQWFKCFRDTPDQLVRPKNITRLQHV